MEKGVIQKKEVEELIGCGIADSQFSEALRRAVQKQRKIYRNGGGEAVLQRRYLLALTGECARDIIISHSLWDLYAGAVNMEKALGRSHSAKSRHPYCNSPSTINQEKV